MSTTFEKPSVTLNQHNFGRWKVMVRAVLEAKDVLEVVDGTSVKPAVDAAAATRKAWQKADATARVILIASLDDEHEKFVRGCGTGKDIWDTICRLKESTAVPNVQLAWQELHSIKWDGATPVAGYLGRVNEAVERLKSLRKEPDNANVMGLILSSLPAKFTTFRTTWNMTKLAADVKLLDLQSALLAAEADLNSQSMPAEEADTGALTAGNKRRGAFNKKKRDDRGKRTIICYGCQGEGHIKSECPSREESTGSKGARGGTNGKRRPAGSAMMAGTFDDGWYGDTGAYRHMTSHREWFHKLLPANDQVMIGDGTPLQAAGIGSIQVKHGTAGSGRSMC